MAHVIGKIAAQQIISNITSEAVDQGFSSVKNRFNRSQNQQVDDSNDFQEDDQQQTQQSDFEDDQQYEEETYEDNPPQKKSNSLLQTLKRMAIGFVISTIVAIISITIMWNFYEKSAWIKVPVAIAIIIACWLLNSAVNSVWIGLLAIK